MTREMQIAVERAARAAQTDPLVEALQACRIALSYIEDKRLGEVARINAMNHLHIVLAKYAPDREGGAE